MREQGHVPQEWALLGEKTTVKVRKQHCVLVMNSEGRLL